MKVGVITVRTVAPLGNWENHVDSLTPSPVTSRPVREVYGSKAQVNFAGQKPNERLLHRKLCGTTVSRKLCGLPSHLAVH